MKRLVIVLLAMTACGVELQPNRSLYPTSEPELCETPGATRCSGTWLQTCTNGVWIGTNCNQTGAECTETSPGSFGCEVTTACGDELDFRCSGAVVEVCEVGAWHEIEDCGRAGGSCVVTGDTVGCQAASCSQPDEVICLNGLVLECNAGYWVVEEDCADNNPPALCVMDSSGSYCDVDPEFVCSPSYLGSTMCNDDVLYECNGQAYVTQEDCRVSDEICVEYFEGVARCEPPVQPAGLFETCTGTGQGNCVGDDQICGEVTLLSEGGLCIIDCGADPSLCNTIDLGDGPTPGYCEPGAIDGGGAFSSAPFCFPVAGRNEMCMFNDDGCVGAETSCQTITDGLNPECKLSCPAEEIGTAATLCGGQQCLRGPYIEVEQMAGSDRTCTTEGSATECTATYECLEVTTSSETVGLHCARRAGLCGNEVPAAAPFAGQNEVSTYLDDDTHMCDLLGTDQYCGADDVGGATNECVSTGFAFRYDPAIPCGGFDDSLGCFGLGECITFDGVNFECGVGIAICQRFCTTRNGEELSGTPCDTGTCQTPTYPIGAPAIQWDDATDEPVFCDSNPTVCDPGFSCDSTTYSDAAVCAKERRVCGP